jgi:hypothetical protein
VSAEIAAKGPAGDHRDQWLDTSFRVIGYQAFRARLWLWRQYAMRTQCLLEVFVLKLKDNRECPLMNIQDERGIDG